MTLVRLLPVVLGLLVLAAHFLRSGSLPLVGAALALIALLAVRRPWVAHVVRVALVLGAAEWGRTLVRLAAARHQAGVPAGRMILILGGVAVVTALSTLVFRSRRVRGWFRLPRAAD